MEDIYQAMKKLKTEDEATKRLLLVVHYMNQQPIGFAFSYNGLKSQDLLLSMKKLYDLFENVS